jgi:hypothetical protein
MVQRYTRSVTLQDSLRFYRRPFNFRRPISWYLYSNQISRTPYGGTSPVAGAGSRDASALFPAPARFFAGRIWVVSGSYGAFVESAYARLRQRLSKPRFLAWGLRPYSDLAHGASLRPNGQAGSFFVAVPRRGAPGGAVAGSGTRNGRIPPVTLILPLYQCPRCRSCSISIM